MLKTLMLMMMIAAMPLWACGDPGVHVDTEESALACGTISHWVCAQSTEIVINPDGSETWTITASCYPPESTSPCASWFERIAVEGAATAASYREILSQLCAEAGIADGPVRACVGGSTAPSAPTPRWNCTGDTACDRYGLDECTPEPCTVEFSCPEGQKLASLSCPNPANGYTGYLPRRHADSAVGDALEGACLGAGGGSTTTRNGAHVECP
jgi:hypothetical protein